MTRSDRVQPATDEPHLRGVLGHFATGVTVVTAGTPVPRGMTANSFTSVSMDPPLVLVCVKRTAAMHEAISTGGAFAISVLSARQEWVARYFANRSRPRGPHEFDVIDWVPGAHTGVPIVANSLAWLECTLAAVHDGGDHSIFVGSVLDSGRDGGRDALLFFCGAFHRITHS